MLKFDLKYFSLFLSLLVVEVGIALYVHDEFFRPFVGDFLAVIAVYFFVRSFFKLTYFKALLASLLVSYVIEVLQYVDFLSIVHLKSNKFLRILFGSTFHWGDILAYSLGAVMVFLVENKRTRS
jgi:hypothetical protein